MKNVRRFTKRVQIWDLTTVSDAYGGETVTRALNKTVWADVETVNSNNLIDYGLDVKNLVIKVTMYKRDLSTITNFIMYGGDEYYILTYPTDKDFSNKYLTFLAVRND